MCARSGQVAKLVVFPSPYYQVCAVNLLPDIFHMHLFSLFKLALVDSFHYKHFEKHTCKKIQKRCDRTYSQDAGSSTVIK